RPCGGLGVQVDRARYRPLSQRTQVRQISRGAPLPEDDLPRARRTRSTLHHPPATEGDTRRPRTLTLHTCTRLHHRGDATQPADRSKPVPALAHRPTAFRRIARSVRATSWTPLRTTAAAYFLSFVRVTSTDHGPENTDPAAADPFTG